MVIYCHCRRRVCPRLFRSVESEDGDSEGGAIDTELVLYKLCCGDYIG